MKTTESLFLQRHGEKIEAALGCYDRLVITGTLLDVAYPAAVQHRLNERDLRCFELAPFSFTADSLKVEHRKRAYRRRDPLLFRSCSSSAKQVLSRKG